MAATNPLQRRPITRLDLILAPPDLAALVVPVISKILPKTLIIPPSLLRPSVRPSTTEIRINPGKAKAEMETLTRPPYVATFADVSMAATRVILAVKRASKNTPPAPINHVNRRGTMLVARLATELRLSVLLLAPSNLSKELTPWQSFCICSVLIRGCKSC